jgi:recombination protein U
MQDGQRSGQRARQAGRSFERELDLTNAIYAQRGWACLGRGHPEVGGIPGKGLYFKGKADVDYFGVADGRPIAYDAKSRAGEVYFDFDSRDFHQLDFLLRFQKAGGVAFLLVRDHDLGRIYLLGVDPIRRLRDGVPVQLRRELRGAADAGAPIVPCVVVTEQQQLEACARLTPIWPWLELLRALNYAPTFRSFTYRHEEAR